MRWLFALLPAVCALTLPAKADTLVVLPFFNGSSNNSIDWVGESLSESIREALAGGGDIVIGRDDRALVYRRLSIRPYVVLTRASVIKIAETLDAEKVVYGRFDLQAAPAGEPLRKGSLRVTAHVLDLRHMKQGPEFQEAGALEDLAVLQRHLAWQALRFVMPGGAPSETEFMSRHPAVRVDAIENYIRGLVAANRDEKDRLFRQAVRLDPSYTLPFYQLGKLHFANKEYKVAGDWLAKVPAADNHYREAQFFLGLALYQSGDFAGAQNAFQAVAHSVPLNEVYNDLGAAESRRNLPDAVESFKKALEGDPGDPDYQFNVGYALWKQGDFDGAAQRFRAALDRNPHDEQASAMLDRAMERRGPRPGDAATQRLERLKTNYEESAWRQLKAALQPQKP